jgi:phosphoserine phosphatase RsbU/P
MNNDLVAMLQTLNIVLNQRRGGESPALTTVIVGTLQPDDRGVEVHLASGGHPPALWLGAEGSAEEIATTGGQAVGIVEEPHFAAATLHLSPGDTLLLYTDGLTEARTGAGPQRFDDDGSLLEYARRLAPVGPSDAIAALGGLLAELGDGVEDDVALMAIGAGPPRSSARDLPAAAAGVQK